MKPDDLYPSMWTPEEQKAMAKADDDLADLLEKYNRERQQRRRLEAVQTILVLVGLCLLFGWVALTLWQAFVRWAS